jgi:hypothetical protein
MNFGFTDKILGKYIYFSFDLMNRCSYLETSHQRGFDGFDTFLLNPAPLRTQPFASLKGKL